MITTVFTCFYMCLMRFDPFFLGVKLLQPVSICLKMLQKYIRSILFDSVCFIPLFSVFEYTRDIQRRTTHGSTVPVGSILKMRLQDYSGSTSIQEDRVFYLGFEMLTE